MVLKQKRFFDKEAGLAQLSRRYLTSRARMRGFRRFRGGVVGNEDGGCEDFHFSILVFLSFFYWPRVSSCGCLTLHYIDSQLSPRVHSHGVTHTPPFCMSTADLVLASPPNRTDR